MSAANDKLQIPQAKRLRVQIVEITNGFIVTTDGDSTYFPTYSEAFAMLAVPRAVAAKRQSKRMGSGA